MQRSQKYDWFKGSQGKGNKKDAKQGLKTTWKFTKIFLIFIVLFISLWGCVQGFTLKQSSFVGKGTEFYLNEEEIPPHITEFKVHGDVTAAAPDVYLEKTDRNVWLNREDDKNNGATMKAVHAELAKQGLTSMADAYKGVNEAIRIVDKSDKPLNDEQIVGGSTKPLVASTATNNDKGTAFAGTDINTTFGITGNKDALITNFLWLTDLTDSNKKVHFQEQKMGTNDKTVGATGADKYKIDYRNALFKALNDAGGNWIIDALKLEGRFAALKAVAPTIDANGKGEILLTTDQKTLYDQAVKAQGRAMDVLNFLGYSLEDGKLTQPDNNYIPQQGGDTYVPILTWSQAWTRGVGPFYGLVVFPISKFTTLVADAFPFMSGWETLFALVVVIFVLRFLGFLISFRSTLQQTKMQELNLKKAAIDAKYAPYKGNKQMQARQRQEVSEMYKKEGVSPLGAFSNTLIVMPLFLAIWRVIGSTPHIKSTVWYGINFSATSWRELFHGDVIYLPLMVLAVAFSIGSQLFPKFLTRKRDKMRGNAHLKQAMKKGQKTQIIIMIITAGMSLIFSAGLQVYWIVVAIWMIIQSYATHEILKWKHKKDRMKVSA